MHLSRALQDLLSQARGRCGVFYVKLEDKRGLRAARGLVNHDRARLVLFSPAEGFMFLLNDDGMKLARETVHA